MSSESSSKLLKILPPFLYKRVDETTKLEIDLNEIEPCRGKVVNEWKWRAFKTKKYLVHMDHEGNFSIKPLN